MPNASSLSLITKRGVIALGFAILICLSTWLGCQQSGATATPPAPAPAQSAAAAAAPAVATNPDAGTPPAPPPVSTTAKLVFTTVPPANATVSWGKTRLGVIGPRKALVVVRPRDSGPLDVTVRSLGYLPVQTRAHTFSDARIVVKLTPIDQKATLFGYREPIDAGVPLDGAAPLPDVSFPGVDAGAPQPPPALPVPAP